MRKASKWRREVAAYTCRYCRWWLGRADNETLGKTSFCLLVHTPTACSAPWGPVKAGAVDGTERAVGR